MSEFRRILLTSTFIACLLTAGYADARALRVDSGDWDLSGFLTGSSTENIGFTMDFFGVQSSLATITADGSLALSDGVNDAFLYPFFDTGQSEGGQISQFRFGTTNAFFNQPGIDAGFRVTWQTLDAAGALLNEYQLSMFDLADGRFVTEFNYNQILFGDDDSLVGFDVDGMGLFDLPASLGLSFADYSGVGNDEFTTNCPQNPSALACNNFFYNDMTFGPGNDILPDIANGYFRQIDTNGGNAQGRYLFVTGAVAVPEPNALFLFGLGLLGLAAFRRRRQTA